MAAMAQARLTEFVTTTVRRVTDAFPTQLDVAGLSGQDLETAVARWIESARGHGLRTRRQMALYVDACVLLGEPCLSGDACPPLATTLHDPFVAPELKAEFLRDYLLFACRT